MNNLITVEQANKDNALEVFKPANVNFLIGKIKDEVENYEYDLTTTKGRKDIASLAANVSRSKTFLDALGKDLVADQKKQIALVDVERKKIRDECDKLRDVARKPLTDWENEEVERKAAIGARIDEIRALADVDGLDSAEIQKRISELELTLVNLTFEEFIGVAAQAKDHTLTVLRKEFEKVLLAEKEAAELGKLRKEAAERARVDAENKIREDERKRVEAEQAEKDLQIKMQVEADEINRVNALADAEAQKQKVIERAEQAELENKRLQEQALKDVELAKLKERERIDQEFKEALEKERLRTADFEHRKKINQAAVKSLETITSIDNKLAIEIVRLIIEGGVNNIEIKY